MYRAVDKLGATIDFMLTKKRDFNKATGLNGQPEKVTIDKGDANNLALKRINKSRHDHHKIEIRQIKYHNNIVEQEHRFIKRITNPMMGFKSFNSACVTIAGIELHHMLRKNQPAGSANSPVFEQFYALAA